MDQEEYTRRFVEYMVKNAGFEQFDCGTTVEEYAKDTAEACYGVNDGDSPEEDAEGDMSYWGEE
ncbi:hypothetical protein [Methylobacterium sp. Gmos1]